MKKKNAALARNNLSEVLIKLMDECHIDSLNLEYQTGVPASTINRYRSDTNCNPTLASLAPIAEYFAISISQLIGEDPIDEKRMSEIYKPLLKSGAISVPILNYEQIDAWLAKKEVANLETLKYISLDYRTSNASFAFILEGDSMEPRFSSGTLLIFDPELPVENRDFVLAWFIGDKKPVFRQILIDSNTRYLKSLNPDFKEVKQISEFNCRILSAMLQARMDFKQNEMTAGLKIYTYN